MTSLDETKPLLPLVPVEVEVDKERQSVYKIYSEVGNKDSPRYDFNIHEIDGTEDVRSILNFIMRVEELRKANGHLTDDKAGAHNNIVVSLLHDTARSTYELGRDAAQATAWEAAKSAAYSAAINGSADPANPTAAEVVGAQAASDGVPKPDLALVNITTGLQHMTKTLVPTNALQRVKRYLRRGCRKPADMKIRVFVSHLLRINCSELPLLPPFSPVNSLTHDELIEIVQYAVPNSWSRKLREQGKDPLVMGMNIFLDAMEAIESAEVDFSSASNKDSGTPSKKSSKSSKKAKRSNKSNSNDSGEYYCLKHGKNSTHNTDDCLVLKKLANKGDGNTNTKSKNKTWKRDANKSTSESKKEVAAFLKKAVKKELNSYLKSKDKPNDKKRKADLNAIDADDLSEGEVSLGGFDYDKFDDLNLDDLDDDKSVAVSEGSDE
jgi:hypothetical protein